MSDLTAASSPFNSSVEVGLRALAVLTAYHPAAHGLQRLTVLDYLVVHSDDAHELWMCFFDDPDGNVLALMSEVPIG